MSNGKYSAPIDIPSWKDKKEPAVVSAARNLQGEGGGEGGAIPIITGILGGVGAGIASSGNPAMIAKGYQVGGEVGEMGRKAFVEGEAPEPLDFLQLATSILGVAGPKSKEKEKGKGKKELELGGEQYEDLPSWLTA